MPDRAKAGRFAYPSTNVTSSQTLRAALRGSAEAEIDGIVQISPGGAEFLGGQYNKDMVTGAVALAEFAHIVAEKYPVNVALHTDHCPKDKLDGYVRPLLAISCERVAQGQNPLFQSHMRNGSAEPLAANLSICSGPMIAEINEALDDGVVKMNVDTDTPYAFTRAVAGHMFRNYDGVLKVDGEVGDKKAYDPRTWGKAAEAGTAARVGVACENLRAAGKKMK
ncbi:MULTISPECIES: class II fructose-bisphosphate aldolase [Streptomyces]|uniref:Fructose-bisphosphate aldolase n=1 Tax=Streptomyces mordarskii TaxID=1226758 RepID=A0ABP3MQU6_9ACTN